MNEARYTVVTACDHKFLWGALLLGISMRYNGMSCPYHVLGYDLSEADVRILEGIPNTKVFPTSKEDSRSICTQKPLAVATADTPIIVWMDADCVVSGNVEPYFVCPDNALQIRQRDARENASVYRNYYRRKDQYGAFPQAVIDTWQRDVGDRVQSSIQRSYQTNCFVMNQSHLDFVKLWKKQMEKVIPAHITGVYNPQSEAYSMTDESVINSLFAFSSLAPETHEYLLDRDPEASCIHFGLSPKPWQGWTLQSFNTWGLIQNLLNWANKEGIALPELPSSFRNENMRKEYKKALFLTIYKDIRYKLSSGFRVVLRLFR